MRRRKSWFSKENLKMAQPNLSADHDFQRDREAFKAMESKPANSNSPPLTPATKTSEFDLDDVFEEPSRRPF
jgi:hypothetical protein